MTTLPDPSPLLDDDLQTAIIEGAPAMLWLGDTAGHCVFLNRAQREFWGVRHRDLSDFDWGRTLHPDDADALFGPYAAAMQTQSPFEVEARYLRADGAWRILRTSARPRFGADGRFLGMVGVNVDVTDQRAAEEALRRSSDHLRLALSASGGIGTWVWDVPSDRVFADATFARTFGVAPEAAEAGAPVAAFLDGIAAEDRAAVEGALREAVAGGGPFLCEFRLAADPARWFMARGECATDAEGSPGVFPGVVLEVTDRRQREDQLSLLTRELSHRIKNIFTVVSAMTSFAVKDAPAGAQALEKLGSRFQAMAAAYTLVTAAPGEAEGAPLRALLDRLFAPYGGAERIRVEGPDLNLGQKAASSLALILHERATNAAKYGALSEGGTVRLRLMRDDDSLRLDWEEAGGPQPEGPPGVTGFGSKLIEASVSTLGARQEEDWRPAGLRWTLAVPMDRLDR